MLRQCPTDDRIIGGSSQSMCDIGNSQFCGQQSNYALTPALLQRNTENCRAYHFNHRIIAPTELSKIMIKIRNA